MYTVVQLLNPLRILFVENSNQKGYTFSTEDNDIIENVLNGYKDDFQIIIEKYTDKIFRYTYYHFNFSKDLAEEVTQEIFLHVWKKLDKFDKSKKFQPWLYRIAYNYCIDYIRKEGKGEVYNIEDIQIESKEDNNLLDKEYKKSLIYSLLKELNDKQKQAIILFYFEEKSYEDIAYIFGESTSYVGTCIYRAKQKLKKIIQSNPKLEQALEFDLM
ncbi:RNA polymerase sigma factor [Candidatus Absconditicoccus praedator]|uniref:RNA polymerase sigma factor n=1 Tax=Candidatus Absconditicoccus praedator TaxID=2735562 RepID=UPI001E459E3F|nr:sigma-70 family RNA polymerase sigma factor [Candidatus Absconditicoccus praedator]UFX83235.1 sigma-70 family RNA polymerase sigma factor [Candidatus Absconditicoccus praedator]